jgi:hypothetical protein
VPWWVWIAIGVFVLSLFVGLGGVLVGLRRLAGTSKALERRLTPALASLDAATARLSQKGATAGHDREVAALAVGRLRASMAQLKVLTDALEEFRLVLRVVRLVRSVR